jgi:hypothetical protein
MSTESGLPLSVRGALRQSHRVEGKADEFGAVATPTHGVKTEFSATVFSGQPHEWVQYLSLGVEARYERGVCVHVHMQRDLETLAFEARGADSEWLANLLRQGLRHVRQRLEGKPNVLSALDELMFGDEQLCGHPIVVRLSPHLPSLGTREMGHPDAGGPGEVRLVLQSRFAHQVHEALEAGVALSKDEKLGLSWSVLSRFLSQLAFPTAPRDRFVAKVEVFAKMTYVALNLLYEARRAGRLVPREAGAVYEMLVAEANDMAPAELCDRHPYFRMLSTLSFMLRASPYREYAPEAQIAAREYLDRTYLRLSLAGAMPDVPPAMEPMVVARKRGSVRVPTPEVGLFGIFDAEDLQAWKKVNKPFRELGFTLLRQLGMGEFGRVYEVLNENNPTFPARVALKVDRIVGKKRRAILEAEVAFRVGRELAGAPHLVRLYDTGKLDGERFTYHVLQLIDGDTLDNLVGVVGKEHASVTRPPPSGRSEREAQREYERAVSLLPAEAARRRQLGLPFRFALSPAMLLDLLTSVLLALEEVHALGYAINDLKNDNLMMSRRGQVKGIDLDSFAPVKSSADKVTDFMFLSGSMLLLLFNAGSKTRSAPLPWDALARDEALLRAELIRSWPLGDVETSSDGRVTREEMTKVLVDLVRRSRQLIYTKQPQTFAADIVRLIDVKRRLLVEDLVID